MDFVWNMFYPVERLFGEWHLLKGNKCLQGVLIEEGVASDKVWHLQKKYSQVLEHPVLSNRHRAHSQNNRRHVAYVRKAVDSELDPTDGPSILTVK